MAIRVTETDGSQWVDAESFDEVLTALRTVLDQVDYTAGNEMVGAVLPVEIIEIAHAAIAKATEDAA